MSEFFVLLPIRDESDIIAQFLDHLLKWADAIYASVSSCLHFRGGDIEFHVLNFGDAPAMNMPAARGITHII